MRRRTASPAPRPPRPPRPPRHTRCAGGEVTVRFPQASAVTLPGRSERTYRNAAVYNTAPKHKPTSARGRPPKHSHLLQLKGQNPWQWQYGPLQLQEPTSWAVLTKGTLPSVGPPGPGETPGARRFVCFRCWRQAEGAGKRQCPACSTEHALCAQQCPSAPPVT